MFFEIEYIGQIIGCQLKMQMIDLDLVLGKTTEHLCVKCSQLLALVSDVTWELKKSVNKNISEF